MRSRPDLGVPDDVLEGFDHYLALWSEGMETEVFVWEGEVDVVVLRHLAAHWARLVTFARNAEGMGLLPADPEGEAFFDALATGMAVALAMADDAEGFAPKFEEVVPDFDHVGVRAPLPEGGLRRVLLVDDNADIRLLVRIGLEANGGFSIVGEACDGEEAVRALEVGCPDAILLDLAMPVMDGFEALPLLQQRCPAARIVVFSASDPSSAKARLAAAGDVAFLRKDAGIAQVVEALRSS
ncbi:MAG: response regulator transcription factor [Actinomycetota bacterium]|nr:response regulator transcription factor [Actinomycetota bacterium]